jgi:hypothetical protein
MRTFTRKTGTLVGALALVAMLAIPSVGTAQSPVGVWQMTHWENATGQGEVPQPAYTAYFDNGYYTVMWEMGDAPRPSLGDDPTDAQRLAAWTPFAAQFGTFEVSGSDIRYVRLVSKDPEDMRPGNQSFVRGFRVEGNTLTTYSETATYTYRRVD